MPELPAELAPLIDKLARVWLARNWRGVADSVARLERLAELLAGRGSAAT